MNSIPVGASYMTASNQSVIARFMSGVYAWMTVGLCLSGAIAWYIGSNEQLAASILTNKGLLIGLVIAQFAAVLSLSFLIDKIGSSVAMLIYLAYAALTGVTLSSIFIVYTTTSVFQVFGLTAFGFAGLSGYGFITKRDLGPVGSFCVMGLFGLIGYALLGIFFHSMMGGTAGFIYSLAGIVIFAGLTAWDTQKIKAMGMGLTEGSEEESKGTVVGALTLYLDFINLFLQLLRLLGNRRD